MKKVLDSLKNNKYITLIIALMLTFAYVGGLRKYIYDNCSKMLSFARAGADWFNLSIGIAILMFVAVCVGIALMFLIRKKVTMNIVVSGYGIASVLSILIMLFTPYNLQLLSPSTNMDTLAKVALYAKMILGLVEVVLLSATLSSHILLAVDFEKLTATIVVSVATVLSVLIVCLCVAFNCSLQIYFGVVTLLLLILNIVNSVTKSERENNISLVEVKINWIYVSIVIAVIAIALIATLTSYSIVVEKAVSLK